MQIPCSHCSQLLEIDTILLGQAIACPLCEHVFTAEIPTDEFPPESPETDPIHIPEAIPLATPLPSLPRNLPKDLPSFMPATITPRRPAPPMPSPPQKKKSGGHFMLFLILLCIGGFGYGMIHYQESPQGFLSHIKRVPLMLLQLPPEQTLRKLSNFCGLTSTPKLPHTPALTSSPIQEGTPAPDLITWLVANPSAWPHEVTLISAVDFPIIVNGQPAGMTNAPVGSTLPVVKIASDSVAVTFGSSTQNVPISSTDLSNRVSTSQFWADAQAKARQSPDADKETAARAASTPISQGNPTAPSDTDAIPQSTPIETKLTTPFGNRQ